MKQLMLTTAMIILLAAPSYAFDKSGLFGLGIEGSLSIPASGDLTSDSSLGDAYDAGPKFGAFASFTPVKELTLQVGFKYGYTKMKEAANGLLPLEPHLVIPEIYLAGRYNLGQYLGSETSVLNPYLSVGVSLVPWKFTDDGAGGDAVMIDTEEFKATSLGLNFGTGLEAFVSQSLSITLAGRYLMIFSEDEEKFGADFGNLSTIDLSAGLTMYFPLSSN